MCNGKTKLKKDRYGCMRISMRTYHLHSFCSYVNSHSCLLFSTFSFILRRTDWNVDDINFKTPLAIANYHRWSFFWFLFSNNLIITELLISNKWLLFRVMDENTNMFTTDAPELASGSQFSEFNLWSIFDVDGRTWKHTFRNFLTFVRVVRR